MSVGINKETVMKEKKNLIKVIRTWGILLLLSFTLILIFTNIYFNYHYFKINSSEMRIAYVEKQKKMIKHQVMRVVDRINNEKLKSETLTKQQVKQRVNEAYSIIENIYNQNINEKSKSEIQKMIIDALRPVRFNNGNGYYFINDLLGNVLLYPTIPSYENQNILNLQDSQGNYVIREQNKICLEKEEGFVTGYWSKPDSVSGKKDYKKITYIKYFKPYNFYIGTGLYVDDIEEQMKENLLEIISKVRFGNEGYIFINNLNGNALLSNGKRLSGDKKLWEAFNKNPQKTKSIFKKEYDAAIKPDGDFIYYSWQRLTDSKVESPKSSFIYGIPDWQWLIGAGVYLDDVESEIATLQKKTETKTIEEIFFIILLTIIIVILFIILLNLFTKKITNDMNLFISFFQKATFSDEPINRNKVKFSELDKLAENANIMLENKIKGEQNLINEKERLFVTIRSIGDGVITTDDKGKIVLLNNIAERLTGWKTDEAVGKNLEEVFKIVNTETGEFIENPVDKVIEFGEIVKLSNHSVLISKDKTEYKISDSAAPIKDSKGQILGVILVFSDVTQEILMQKKIIENERNYRLITESTSDYISKIDLKGKYIYVSPSHSLLGYTKEDLLGKSGFDFIHPDDVGDLPGILQGFIQNPKKESITLEYRFKDKENRWHNLNCKINSILDKEGSLESLIFISRDITERKKAEKELHKMAKLTSIGTLAGGIAHDFNNILTGIYGNISLAQLELSENHPGFEFLKEAEKSMTRAIQLTKQLLTFSKGGTPVKENVNISKIIHEIVNFDLSGSNVKPVFKKSDNLWNAQIDKGQIGQVFSNLTINAKQAMPEGGHLYISMENVAITDQQIVSLKEGDYIKITVQDEGTGIDKKHFDKIFDPYFTTKQTGNGLGLATTFSIIQQHNGHIEIDSELGKGTTFVVYLPASKSEIDETEKHSKIKPIPVKQSAKILVMDDEEVICKLVTEMLKGIGFFAETVCDGEKAIEKYKESIQNKIPYDVIILDLTIPGGMGGKETIKHILDINHDAKVIVSSGYSSGSTMADYKEYGFRGILSKPYTMTKLRKVLNEVLVK